MKSFAEMLRRKAPKRAETQKQKGRKATGQPLPSRTTKVLKVWRSEAQAYKHTGHYLEPQQVQWADLSFDFFAGPSPAPAAPKAGKHRRNAGFRNTARDIVQAWDHQLRAVTKQGLRAFLGHPASYSLGANGLEGHTLVLRLDQCSSGVAGVFWLQFHMGARLCVLWDIFHKNNTHSKNSNIKHWHCSGKNKQHEQDIQQQQQYQHQEQESQQTQQQ